MSSSGPAVRLAASVLLAAVFGGVLGQAATPWWCSLSAAEWEVVCEGEDVTFAVKAGVAMARDIPFNTIKSTAGLTYQGGCSRYSGFPNSVTTILTDGGKVTVSLPDIHKNLRQIPCALPQDLACSLSGGAGQAQVFASGRSIVDVEKSLSVEDDESAANVISAPTSQDIAQTIGKEIKAHVASEDTVPECLPHKMDDHASEALLSVVELAINNVVGDVTAANTKSLLTKIEAVLESHDGSTDERIQEVGSEVRHLLVAAVGLGLLVIGGFLRKRLTTLLRAVCCGGRVERRQPSTGRDHDNISVVSAANVIPPPDQVSGLPTLANVLSNVLELLRPASARAPPFDGDVSQSDLSEELKSWLAPPSQLPFTSTPNPKPFKFPKHPPLDIRVV